MGSKVSSLGSRVSLGSEKDMGNYYSLLGLYIGTMEKKMETTRVYWGYIGRMEKKMDTTIVYWGCIGLGFRVQGIGFKV